MSKTPKNVDLLQQLMDNIDDNIFFKDSDSKFIMINKSNAKWFGLDDPREIVKFVRKLDDIVAAKEKEILHI